MLVSFPSMPLPPRRFAGPIAACLLALCAALLPAAGFAQSGRGGPAQPPAEPRDPALVAAEAAVERGDCLAASEGFARAAQGSRDPRIARRATEIAVVCRQSQAAWKAASRWRALDGENVDALRAAFLVALDLYRVRDAREILASLLGKPDVELDRAMGELLPLIAESDYANAGWAAMDGLVDAAKLEPPTRLAFAELAIASYHYAAARRIVEDLIAADAGNAAAQAMLARLQAAEGNSAAALAAARAAAAADPENHGFAVAETLAALDRNEDVQAELEARLSDPAARDEAGRRLALLALSNNELDVAERRFGERLQRSGPGAAEALFYLGAIAERRNNTALALQTYQRLVEAGAGLLPRARAAALLLERDERAAAMKLLDDLVRAQPGEAVDVEIARSELLADAGDNDAAIDALDAALRVRPGQSALLYQRAVMLERAGRSREAIRGFEALLRDRPDDPSIQNALGYTLADRNRQLDRAEKLLRQAVAGMPDNAAVIDSVGWVLFRRGKAAEALPLLERAYRLGRDPEIAAHLGEVLWALGRQGEARAVWARSLARYPDSDALASTIARVTGQPFRPFLPNPAGESPAGEPPQEAPPRE